MVNWKRVVWIVTTFWLVYTNPAHCQPPPVSVQARPRICLAPCTVRIEVHVPHHPDNRILAVTWVQNEDITNVGESEFQIDGAESQTLFERYVERLEDGHYTVYATLVRKTDGKAVDFVANATWQVGADPKSSKKRRK